MENNLNQQVLDKLTKVCICKAIPRSKIKDAIKAGAHTVEEVSKVIGAGTGGVQRIQMYSKIQVLIDEHLKNKLI